MVQSVPLYRYICVLKDGTELWNERWNGSETFMPELLQTVATPSFQWVLDVIESRACQVKCFAHMVNPKNILLFVTVTTTSALQYRHRSIIRGLRPRTANCAVKRTQRKHKNETRCKSSFMKQVLSGASAVVPEHPELESNLAITDRDSAVWNAVSYIRDACSRV